MVDTSQRRRGSCFICGKRGHFAKDCRQRQSYALLAEVVDGINKVGPASSSPSQLPPNTDQESKTKLPVNLEKIASCIWVEDEKDLAKVQRDGHVVLQGGHKLTGFNWHSIGLGEEEDEEDNREGKEGGEEPTTNKDVEDIVEEDAEDEVMEERDEEVRKSVHYMDDGASEEGKDKGGVARKEEECDEDVAMEEDEDEVDTGNDYEEEKIRDVLLPPHNIRAFKLAATVELEDTFRK
ncbi:hypothetical protein HOLleu_42618 [Holothuria leucospilota]|uniref:CCHC-type domain-containing protein n=1 Tax=Holothuria leucospilota TaxID=206669 RepID=A0A9Q1B999_HOLLE|nr:hypothetical protein HOLleu_42618 [Holothuria leucospilota]